MKNLCLAAFAAAAVALNACSTAKADVIFDYIALPATAADVNPVSAGATVTYEIFLRQSLTGGSSELVNSSGGLIGAGFFVKATSGNSAAITGVNFDPSFGTQLNGTVGPTGQRNFDATQARLSENSLVNVLMQEVSPTEFRARLGTVTIAANSGSTTFSVSSYVNAPTGTFGGSGQNGNTLFGPADLSALYDADVTNGVLFGPNLNYTGANSAGATNFTVTASAVVPEPSSFLLGGAFVVGGIGAYRRRKAAAAAVNA
jgi:hypothetical protein